MDRYLGLNRPAHTERVLALRLPPSSTKFARKQSRLAIATPMINHIDTFDKGDTPTFKMHGGGGTDFRSAVPAQHRRAGNAGLHGVPDRRLWPVPRRAPDYPVLWVMTTDVVARLARPCVSNCEGIVGYHQSCLCSHGQERRHARRHRRMAAEQPGQSGYPARRGRHRAVW